MKRTVLYLLVCVGLLLPFAFYQGAATSLKVVVLGFDGLDPRVVSDLMAKGLLPAFSALREQGSYFPLATTNPAQSPVAWSSFITGNNPGRHNVFDFITRDPETYLPKLTISEIEKPDFFEIGKYRVPLETPVIKSYRQGKPFWEFAGEQGIPTTVLLIPVTFPPDTFAETTLAGMGVPDVTGTNGTFSFYTSEKATRTTAEGGRIVKVKINGGEVNTALRGPRNEFLIENPHVEIPFRVALERPGHATISIQGQEIRLAVGEWSGWTRLTFPLVTGIDLKAIVKFYLKSLAPDFQLYVSPVNFDPADPALPISHPESYSRELAEKIGPFYTQGMPEDTWALNEDRLSDQAFLEQVKMIQEERIKIFFSELQKLQRGILSAVFVSSDRIQHMFWRNTDPGHPLFQPGRPPAEQQVIQKVYRHMDSILARVMKYIDKETVLMVLSDHGFENFRRSVHLNSWLIREGFMQLKVPFPESTPPFFENVDWAHTKAYAMGLNGLWLNLKGREKEGIVSAAEAEPLKEQLTRRLLQLRDGQGQPPVVRRIFDRDDIYQGDFAKNAPDLVIGYDRGYRASWQTVLGGAPLTLLDDNRQKWSGDHLIDPALVPGIFLINRPVTERSASIMDVAPTILSLYDINNHGMDGKAMTFKP